MRTAALLLCALALAASGCGGDDEPPPKPAPELTLPQSKPRTTESDATGTGDTTGTGTETGTSTDTAPQTETDTTPGDSGGQSGGTPSRQGDRRQQLDSPQNDLPPPKNSPEERFENFCKDNPGACG